MASEDDDLLQEARECFQHCEEREEENRREALDDLEFARLAKQWRPEDEAQRAAEGRPCLTINRMPAFIRQVVNDARQNSPAITVHPVDSKADPKTAEVFSGLIRDIETQSDADTAYDTAVDFAVTCGFGYFRINTEYTSDDSFEQDIRIKRVPNNFSVYGDPYSDGADSSDWNVAFVMDKLKKSEFKRRFPDADMVNWDTDYQRDWGEAWWDGEQVGVAEYWTREQTKHAIIALSNGMVIALKEYEANKALFDAQEITVVGSPRQVATHKVTQRLMTGAEVLETTEWAGKFIPIVPVYGDEVNVEGRRYLRSLIRDAKDPQRMFNYWRTASTELVALAPKAPWVGKKGTFKSDAAKWATANRVSHQYIEYDGEAPQRTPFTGVPAGAIQESLNASDDMKAIIGLHDASLGARSNETSGRAIMLRQREGDVSTFHFQDNLKRAIRHGGRILIDLIPKVYSTARVIRTLGIDGTTQTIPINQPVREVRQGDQTIYQISPEEIHGVTRMFDLTAGKYDLAVKTGPSFTTQREEAVAQMTALIQAYPAAAPVVGDLLVQNLDWPGADKVSKRLKAMLPPQLQAAEGDAPQDPMQSPQVQQVLMQGQQVIQQQGAQIQDLSQQLDEAKKGNAIKLQENLIKSYEAQTDRIKTTGMVVPGPLESPTRIGM